MNLRPMRIEDADFLLELKNYEETRKFSIASHEEIKREDHLRYLEANVEYFQVIENQLNTYTQLFGVVRIIDGEISIWINKEYWGKGIATWVLEIISYRGCSAKIVEGNIPSMRCFINAGFKPVKRQFFEQTAYYIFEK